MPTMTSDQIEQQIREFLAGNFIFDPSVEVGIDDSFMENGIVDSTGVLELITWVEGNFGVHVEDAEVLPENFDSIRTLTNYTLRKTGTSAPVA
jgi:acyl carrier protein